MFGAYILYINLKDTINITSFLLCFCCEEIAFWIYDSLINEFKMQELFKQENDFFEKEIAFIKNLGNVFKIFSEENEKNIQKFLEETLPKFFKSLFFNELNFQIVYFIWDMIFSKGSVIILLFH